jgi:hypothetical protein
MPEAPPPEASADSAWVSVASDLAPARLLDLLQNPDRLMRVNSQWVFAAWESLGLERYRFRIQNRSNGQLWETEARVVRLPDGLRLDYQTGVKASTRLRVEVADGGSRLWIIDDYARLPQPERQARIGEVDRSLPRWGQDLYRHLRAWSRWSGVAPWRWYIERVWLRMQPLSRRLVLMLVWITAAELVLFGLLIAILIAESRG